MPAPGPGGTQSSLATMVAWLTKPFRGKPNQTNSASGNQQRRDIGQFQQEFQDTFQPPDAGFAPGFPLVPTQREPPRRFDYPSFWNTVYTPRSFEAIGFAELRALADAHDITRLAIETRKDQIAALDWQIRSIDKKAAAGAEGRIATLTEFWRRPDGISRFDQWLRECVEEVLVTDALAIEVRINRGGQIIGLDQISGSTIKPLLDGTGRRPRPPAPAYEQVIHGRPWVLLEDGNRADTEEGEVTNQFNDGQLIYAPRNPRIHRGYGFSPVESIITTINIGLRRQATQLLHFTEGNVPPGLLSAPEGWTTQQIAEFQEWFDSILKGNIGARTRLVWGPGGSKYQAFTESPFKDEFDEWLARIVCYAFSLPPSAFTPQVNRATAQTAQETALEEGLAPLLIWVARLISEVIQTRQGHPDLEFAWAEKHEVDPAVQAKVLDTFIKNGSYTINEARDVLGLDPVEGGDDNIIVTAAGPVLLTDVATISSNTANPPPPPPAGAGGGGGGAPGDEPPKGKAEGGKSPAGKALTALSGKRGAAEDGTSPFSRRYLETARSGIERSVAAFLQAESGRVARDVLSKKTTANYNSNYSSKASDHTDPDQHGVTPATNAHTERQVAAAAAAAIAQIDFGRWSVLVDDIAPELTAVAQRTAIETLDAVSAGLTPNATIDAVKEWARKWAKDRAAELVGRRTIGDRTIPTADDGQAITSSTADMIAGAARDAIRDGSTVSELAEALGKSPAFSPARAKRIADYETKNALHEATMHAFKASNRVKGSYWVTMNDLRVTAECLLNEAASPVALGTPFPSGHHRPMAHGGCRCWLSAWI
jgi:HK97 family phage portal protein